MGEHLVRFNLLRRKAGSEMREDLRLQKDLRLPLPVRAIGGFGQCARESGNSPGCPTPSCGGAVRQDVLAATDVDVCPDDDDLAAWGCVPQGGKQKG